MKYSGRSRIHRLLIAFSLFLLLAFGVNQAQANFAPLPFRSGQAALNAPSPVWNTFLGGTYDDTTTDIVTDSSGNLYVLGVSTGTWGAPKAPYGGYSAPFLAKLNQDGALQWSTFIAGNTTSSCAGIALDSVGNLYIAGSSNSSWGTPKNAFSGSDASNAYIAKLSPDGDVVWNTFWGSGSGEYVRSLAVDPNGNVTIVGNSYHTWGSPKRAFNSSGLDDAFAAKIDANGNLLWNTFLGGSNSDDTYSVAYGGTNLFISGNSSATWGSPLSAYTSSANNFVAKLDQDGNLAWNTFLGGGSATFFLDIQVDHAGRPVLTGWSTGSWGSPIRAFTDTNGDGFVAQLSPDGAVLWNTFLGTNGLDAAINSIVDSSNSIYFTGHSQSAWGPSGGTIAGKNDAFTGKLSSEGALQWVVFSGSTEDDSGHSLTFGHDGNLVVAGYSKAAWGSPIRSFSNSADTFVMKLVSNAPVDPTPPSPTPGIFLPLVVR